MPRERSKYQFKSHIVRWCLILFIAASSSSCSSTPSTPSAIAAATPCTLQATGVNTYEVTPVGVIPTIYNYSAAVTADPVSGVFPDHELRTYQARYAALIRLEDETKRWSKFVEIQLDDTSRTQIMVTFLSPELIQAVYLNNLLKHNTRPADIQTGIQAVLKQLAARNQLIFLVTVLATSQNSPTSTPHSMDILLSQMILMNAENLAVPPSHDDHNLDQPIDLTQDPVFGFLYYPLAVNLNGTCNQVLDPIYNTKIIIETPSLLIDGADTGTQTWTIPYIALLQTDNFHYEPEYTLPTLDYGVLEKEFLSTKELPPISTDDPNFWRDFGRFIWGQLTLEDY